MSDLSYAHRAGVTFEERTYTIGPSALTWTGDGGGGCVPYTDIAHVRVSSMANVKRRPRLRRCILYTSSGDKIVLAGEHYVGIGIEEDRSASYLPFATELLRRATAANPELRILKGFSRAAWRFWLAVAIGMTILFLLLVFVIGAQLVEGQGQLSNAAKMLLFAMVLAALWMMVRGSRPREIDPRTVSFAKLVR